MLWVVGIFIELSKNSRAWDIMGIYDSEEKAKNACIDERYFIGPVLLNSDEISKEKKWNGAYYPLSKDNK